MKRKNILVARWVTPKFYFINTMKNNCVTSSSIDYVMGKKKQDGFKQTFQFF